MIDAGYGRHPRMHPRGYHHGFKTTVAEIAHGRRCVELDIDAAILDPPAEVSQHLVEFGLARNGAREVELAADTIGRLEQRDPVPATACLSRGSKAPRAGADNRDLARSRCRTLVELGFAASARVDPAGGAAVGKKQVKAGVVAGDG